MSCHVTCANLILSDCFLSYYVVTLVGLLQRIDQHKDGLEKAKSEYEELKKTVDELRASEVCVTVTSNLSLSLSLSLSSLSYHMSITEQVDADYKLKDMKKLYKDLEIKGKGYSKQIDDLENATRNQLEQ